MDIWMFNLDYGLAFDVLFQVSIVTAANVSRINVQ